MKELLVVWKTDNDTDIQNFVYPYALNSKKHGWFSDVEVLIWGASQEKVVQDLKSQEIVKAFVEHGINVYACKYCADKVEASELLTSLGVNVMYTGVYLSDKQKDDNVKVLTL